MSAGAAIGGSLIGAAGSALGARAERKGVQQQQALLTGQMRGYDPYTQGGGDMYQNYQEAVTGDPGEAFKQWTQLPGQQFQRQQGMDAIEGSAASRGSLMSGRTLKGLQEYGQNLASNQYQGYLDRLMQGSQFGMNALNAQSNVAQGVGNAMQDVGRAKAAGIMGPTGQISQGLGGMQAQQNFKTMYGQGGSMTPTPAPIP